MDLQQTKKEETTLIEPNAEPEEETKAQIPRLFRLLRDDEDPVRFGIRAKDPEARIDLTEHVSYGSRYNSQYISCSETLSGAIELGKQNFLSNRIRIAVIDAKQLAETRGTIIHYLDALLRCLKTDRAQRFACRFNEVVIDGQIERDCIVEVFQVERCTRTYMFQPPVSLYVKDGFCEESEMRKAVIQHLLGCRLPSEGPSEQQSQQNPQIPTLPRTGMWNCNIL